MPTSRSHALRSVAAAVTLALLAGACTVDTTGQGNPTASGSTSTAPRTAAADAAAFSPGPFGPAQLDADIVELASWGIETFDSPSSTQPAVPAAATRSPLRLLRSQVEQLGEGAAAGTGLTGAALDDVMSTATGVEVPMATLLAGYAGSKVGLVAQLRPLVRIVDTAHPSDAVFPNVLLLAFVHDMVAAAQPGGAHKFADVAFGAHAAVGGSTVCKAASNFLSDVLHKTFDGLKIDKIDTTGWAPVFKVLGDAINAVTAVWNAVMSGAEFVVIQGVNLALGPVRRTLGSLAMVAAIAIQAATLVLPLDGVITIDNPPAYGVDGSPLTYTATLRTSTEAPTEWPEIVRDCADLINLELPDLALAGSAVDWQLNSAGATKRSSEDVLAKDGSQGVARFRFDTATEPQQWHDEGTEAAPVSALLKATVHRKTKVLQDAVQKVLNEAFGFLPEFLRYRAVGFVSAQVNDALDKIVRNSDTVFSLPFDITRHGPPSPTPSPSPSDGPSGAGALWVHVERPSLPGAYAGRIMDITSCTGIAGPWRGKLINGGLHADKLRIDWTDLPMTSFRLVGGQGDSVAHGVLIIPFPVERKVPQTYHLHFSVRGNRMNVTGVPDDAAPYFHNLPILPAPKGSC